MPSDRRSSPPPTTSDPQIGYMREMGWPMTKAAYVAAMFGYDSPDFPLDMEIRLAVPRWLPGPWPRSEMDLLFDED